MTTKSTVMLLTGVEVSGGLVITVHMNLDRLISQSLEGAIAVHELRELCYDANHRVPQKSLDLLRRLDLVQEDGKVQPLIADIVKAAVIGDGAGMMVQNPIKL